MLKKKYIKKFFILKKNLKKKYIFSKNLWVYTYFKIFYKFFLLRRKYLSIPKYHFIYTKIIFFSKIRNKFINILKKYNLFFISAGMYNNINKKLVLEKKKFIKIENILKYTMAKNLLKISRLILIKYLNIKKFIFSTLNILSYKLLTYNKKYIKYNFFFIKNVFLIEKKKYGFMKTKKIARSKRFLIRKRLKSIKK